MYFLFIMSKLLYASQTKVDLLFRNAFDANYMFSNGMKSPAKLKYRNMKKKLITLFIFEKLKRWSQWLKIK